MLKIIKNPDTVMYEAVTQAVKDNDGYCCCTPYRDKPHKCPCETFRKQKTTGLCHCERLAKIDVKEE